MVKLLLLLLVQEDDEQVLNAYFNKYDTQILRWNVESVVEEIEAAAKVQADLYNKARAQMKAERKEARKEKIEEFKNNIKAKFENLKL